MVTWRDYHTNDLEILGVTVKQMYLPGQLDAQDLCTTRVMCACVRACVRAQSRTGILHLDCAMEQSEWNLRTRSQNVFKCTKQGQ